MAEQSPVFDVNYVRSVLAGAGNPVEARELLRDLRFTDYAGIDLREINGRSGSLNYLVEKGLVQIWNPYSDRNYESAKLSREMILIMISNNL